MNHELVANATYYLLVHFLLLTNILSLFPTWFVSVPALILIVSNFYWEITVDFLYLESRISCNKTLLRCDCGGIRAAIKEITFPQMTTIMLKMSQMLFPLFNRVINVFVIGFYVMFYLATRDTKYCVTHKFRWLSHNNKRLVVTGLVFVVLNYLVEMFVWEFLFLHDTWFTRVISSHLAWIVTFYLFVERIQPRNIYVKYTDSGFTPFKYPFYTADIFYNDMLKLIKFIIMNFNRIVQRMRAIDDTLINELIVLLKTRTVKDYLRNKSRNTQTHANSFGTSAVKFVKTLLLTERKVQLIEQATSASPTTNEVSVKGEMFVFLI